MNKIAPSTHIISFSTLPSLSLGTFPLPLRFLNTAHRVPVVLVVVVLRVDATAVEVQDVRVGGTVPRTTPIVRVATCVVHRTPVTIAAQHAALSLLCQPANLFSNRFARRACLQRQTPSRYYRNFPPILSFRWITEFGTVSHCFRKNSNSTSSPLTFQPFNSSTPTS